jgi:capsular exopolysaccharide synthesis family protein
LTESTQSFNHRTLDLQAYQEEIAQAEEVAKKVGAEVAALDVELQAPPRVSLLEGAALTLSEDARRRLKAAAMAGAGALAAAVLAISYLEFRARRIGTVDEVVQGLGLRLVGALPALPHRGAGLLAAPDEPRGRPWNRLFVESIDATRATLLHASQTESCRVIMITSAMAGEGKTSLSSHLATSLARAGRRTLLLDCDLRRPAIHYLFDVPAQPGLGDFLMGQADLDGACWPIQSSDLWVMPAGRCDERAIQELARPRARQVFDRLKERFEFIIVDSAPVLCFADVLSTAPLVDAVIFSILRDVSRAPLVYAAYERLATLGIRMLGATISGAPLDVGASYGYEYAVRRPQIEPPASLSD